MKTTITLKELKTIINNRESEKLSNLVTKMLKEVSYEYTEDVEDGFNLITSIEENFDDEDYVQEVIESAEKIGIELIDINTLTSF